MKNRVGEGTHEGEFERSWGGRRSGGGQAVDERRRAKAPVEPTSALWLAALWEYWWGWDCAALWVWRTANQVGRDGLAEDLPEEGWRERGWRGEVDEGR